MLNEKIRTQVYDFIKIIEHKTRFKKEGKYNMDMTYNGVIFDFNGTLFFDNDKHILAWGEISKMIRGRGITEDELLEHFNGVPNHMIISYLLGREAEQEEIQKYSELKEEFYRRFCVEDKENFHLVEGAEEFFDSLKAKGIPFTIASASIKANIDFFVKEFDLAKWIKPENIIYDDGSYENKIEMFLDAACTLKVEIGECMIVEDSVSGIQNGYKAGCRKIVVMDSAGKAEEYKTFPGVVKVVENLQSL